MKTILSLGAGVQSSVLLLMSIRGELPRLDAAIFADTGWESKATYAHLDWLIEQASGIVPVHVVSAGNLKQDSLQPQVLSWTGTYKFRLPLYTINPEKNKAMLQRRCTYDYKIIPVEREIKRLIGHQAKRRLPSTPACEQWRGITADEAHRMKPSREPWYTVRYPFVEMLDHEWTRHDCIDWLTRNYPTRKVPRSSCLGCPFHSNDEWRMVKDSPEEWAETVQIDKVLRRTVNYGEAFLHRSCKPLDEVDLRTDAECGQLDLWGNECEGMCGL